MKKRNLFWVVCLIGCLMLGMLLVGCKPGGEESEVPSQESEKEDSHDIYALQDPKLESWELYNPNGFDTIFGVISNPNDTAVDVTFDIVYYNQGTVVARNEWIAVFSIMPGAKDVIWINYGVPKKTEADEVKLENITVARTSYPPIGGTYQYVETVENKAYFEFAFDKKPTMVSITFLLYQDLNKNGRYDAGEMVGTSYAELFEQTGRVYFETDVFKYTDYEVFFKAY